MLMALRASHGHVALLFWGGNYGGAIATWVEAPLVAIFGMKIWVFEAVDMAIMLASVFLLRAIGRRFLSPVAADVAAGTFWFFPALWLFWSSRDYIFWLPAMAFALATCLMVLRWFESRRRRDLWASGLFAGLSIWSYPLVLPLVAPPLAILVWSLRKDRRALLGLVVAGTVGVAPWLAYFALHGRAALHRQAVTGSRLSDLQHTVTQVLPTELVGGTKRFGAIWELTHAPPGPLKVLGIAVFFGTVVFTAFAISRREVALAACGVSVIIWPVVLVVGHVPVSHDTYRYGAIVVPPLLLIAAHLLSKVRLAPVLGVGALALVVITVGADTSNFASAPSCTRALADTSRLLVSKHETAVRASYWLAAPLELCSNEQLVVSSVAPVRDRYAEDKAAEAPRSIYVVFPGKELDNDLLAWTRANHVRATRTVPGDYAIWEFDTQVSPKQIGLDSPF
jgi:hypothetical protein